MLGFTETVLRDANQSLAATRMKCEDFESILEEIDKVGYYSVECWGGATFDACLRYLNEDPWERLRLLRRKMPNTKLQMLLRGQNLLGYSHYPTEIVRDFIRKAIENGIDIIRIFDALNDVDNIMDAVKATLDFGGHPSCALCYTVSPVHSVDGYVKLAKQMEEIGAMSICIKDMAGCLTPNQAYILITELKKVLHVPLILHTHNSSGLAQMTCLKAIEAGVDVIDTAISCFSGGTSQAPTEAMALVAQELGRKTQLDINKLPEINNYFKKIFENMFTANVIDVHSLLVDTQALISQVPGGMYSNLLSQMKSHNTLERIEEVMHEIPIVRKDLGYPPLVTPISQMVGTQAVANVISGNRYSIVINEIRDYVLGKYGNPPSEIDQTIKNIILENSVSRELVDESCLERKHECIENGYSEEDMLTFVLFPQLAENFFKIRINTVADNRTKYCCREVNGNFSCETEISLDNTSIELFATIKAILSWQLKKEPNEINIKHIYNVV